MDVTVLMLQNVLSPVSFCSGCHSPPQPLGSLDVTFTLTASPTPARLRIRHWHHFGSSPGPLQIVFQEGDVLDIHASRASDPELTIYQETVWHSGP